MTNIYIYKFPVSCTHILVIQEIFLTDSSNFIIDAINCLIEMMKYDYTIILISKLLI